MQEKYPMREITFYETDFGDRPAEEFLAGLDPTVRAKVVRTLELLRTQQIVPAKFWKKLSGFDLWEVRVEYGGNIYRVLAAFAKNNRVILLHAFQKKSQKTPRQDIEIALQRQKRYFQRHGYL
jgi:phage-related protein